jgi:hypothetical protein
MSGIDEIETLITMALDQWETDNPGIERPMNDLITERVLSMIPDADMYAVLHTLLLSRVNSRTWGMGL